MPHSEEYHPQRSYFSTQLTCTCKKSRCLKLYCHCFAASTTCGVSCSCIDCRNTLESSQEILRARTKILSENGSLRILDKSSSHRSAGFASSLPLSSSPTKIRSTLRSTRRCNCRKSLCLKKYCECYSGNVHCGPQCACLQCKNSVNGERSTGVQGRGIFDMQFKPVVASHKDERVLEAAVAMTELIKWTPKAAMHKSHLEEDQLCNREPTRIDSPAEIDSTKNKRYRSSIDRPWEIEVESFPRKESDASLMYVSSIGSSSLEDPESRNPSPVAMNAPSAPCVDRDHRTYRGNSEAPQSFYSKSTMHQRATLPHPFLSNYNRPVQPSEWQSFSSHGRVHLRKKHRSHSDVSSAGITTSYSLANSVHHSTFPFTDAPAKYQASFSIGDMREAQHHYHPLHPYDESAQHYWAAPTPLSSMSAVDCFSNVPLMASQPRYSKPFPLPLRPSAISDVHDDRIFAQTKVHLRRESMQQGSDDTWS